MPIVSSVIVEDRVQRDGRRSVRERHTDHLSQPHDVAYLAEAGADVQAILAARVPLVEASLAENEHAANLGRALEGLAPLLRHTTLAQFRQRLRAAYRESRGLDAALLGRFVHGLGLTDNQLKALFGVTDAQLPALKTRLQNQAARADAVAADQGE